MNLKLQNPHCNNFLLKDCRSVKLPYKVTAKVIFPFTILKGNACDVLSKGNCPVSVGEEFTYKNIINVSRSYPSVNLQNNLFHLDFIYTYMLEHNS